MGDEHDRAAAAAQLVHLLGDLLLKLRVAAGERFVDEQDLGIEVRRDREREAHPHPDEYVRTGKSMYSPSCANSPIDFGEFGEPVLGRARSPVRRA